MIERIRELSDSQIDSLKALGKDALTALAPPVAYLVYGNGPDQLQALQQLGPSALGAISPQLANMLYGPDAGNADQGLGQPGGNADQGLGQPIGNFEKGLGRYPGQPPIILPPFPQPPRPPDNGGDEGPFPPYPDDLPPDDLDDEDEYKPDPGDMVSWNVTPSKNNCLTCLTNAEDSPRPYGTPFSSGDTGPPIHEYCNCFLTSSMRGSCPIHGNRGDRRIFELSSRY